MGTLEYDERWLRLALVIHEAGTGALKQVLDDGISSKHADLACKSFDERLQEALIRDESQLRRHLLKYEIPTVFPPVQIQAKPNAGQANPNPVNYDSFDLGIVVRLIEYFVGKAVWDVDTAGLPDIDGLQSYDFARARPCALAKLLREFRNWVCHKPCTPHVSENEFHDLWDALWKILNALRCDVSKLAAFKTGPLDAFSKGVADVARQLRDDARARLLDGDALRARVECIEALISRFDVDKATKLEFRDLAAKFEFFKIEQTERMQKVEEKVSEMRTDMVKRDELMVKRDELDALQRCLQPSGGLEEKKRRAQEACWAVHEDLLNCQELDVYGDQIEGKPKAEMMVPLVLVSCSKVDDVRLTKSGDAEVFVREKLSILAESIFQQGKAVLVRGLPGAGKSTFCHFMLREWQHGRLWRDHYELVFYVNAPLLMNYMYKPPFNPGRVLRELYPAVFRHISLDDLGRLKYLVIIDAIDECDVAKICASNKCGKTFEEALKQMIVSRDDFHRIIVGRPHACDEVRRCLLKYIPYDYVEVVGFSTDQVREYVEKFCGIDVERAALVWRAICESSSLLGLSHLPVFANIICTVLCEHASVTVETQTELYVWAYVVFLTRHLKRHPAGVDVTKLDGLFSCAKILDALFRICEMAFTNLSIGKVFFPAQDDRTSDIESTMVTPFLVRRQQFLCFPHMTFMEFFAAVHVMLRGSKVQDKMLHHGHALGILPMLFGLLGAATENSDSPKIIRDFVGPLKERFKVVSPNRHPLFEYERTLLLEYLLPLLFEFRNPRFLNVQKFVFGGLDSIFIESHLSFDHLLYFLENFRGPKKSMWSVRMTPTDQTISVAECSKLSKAIVSDGWRFTEVPLLCQIDAAKMRILAPALPLIRRVQLNDVCQAECWEVVRHCIQDSHKTGTLLLRGLSLEECELKSEEMRAIAPALCLVKSCSLPTLDSESLANFYQYLPVACRQGALALQRLDIKDSHLNEDAIRQVAPGLCSIPHVRISLCDRPVTGAGAWKVFRECMQDAQRNGSLRLDRLELTGFACTFDEVGLRELTLLLCMVRHASLSARALFRSRWWSTLRQSLQESRTNGALRLERLDLSDFYVSDSEIATFGEALCMIPCVELRGDCQANDRCWFFFVQYFQDAILNGTPRLEELVWSHRNVSEASLRAMFQIFCFMRRFTLQLANAISWDSWSSFHRDLQNTMNSRALRDERLDLSAREISEESIDILVSVICLLRTVHLRFIREISDEFWERLLQSAQQSNREDPFRLDELHLLAIDLNQKSMSNIAQILCLILRAELSQIDSATVKCWEIFGRSLRRAYRNGALRLQELVMLSCDLSEGKMRNLAPVFFLMRTVKLGFFNSTTERWKVFRACADKALRGNEFRLREFHVSNIFLDEDAMREVASVCRSIPTIQFRSILTCGSECWWTFVQCLQRARDNNSLRVEQITFDACEVNRAIQNQLKSLVREVVIL